MHCGYPGHSHENPNLRISAERGKRVWSEPRYYDSREGSGLLCVPSISSAGAAAAFLSRATLCPHNRSTQVRKLRQLLHPTYAPLWKFFPCTTSTPTHSFELSRHDGLGIFRGCFTANMQRRVRVGNQRDVKRRERDVGKA